MADLTICVLRIVAMVKSRDPIIMKLPDASYHTVSDPCRKVSNGFQTTMQISSAVEKAGISLIS